MQKRVLIGCVIVLSLFLLGCTVNDDPQLEESIAQLPQEEFEVLEQVEEESLAGDATKLKSKKKKTKTTKKVERKLRKKIKSIPKIKYTSCSSPVDGVRAREQSSLTYKYTLQYSTFKSSHEYTRTVKDTCRNEDILDEWYCAREKPVKIEINCGIANGACIEGRCTEIIELNACGTPEGGWQSNRKYVLTRDITLDNLEAREACFSIANRENIIIDGNGYHIRPVRILEHDLNAPYYGLQIENGHNIQMRDLTISSFPVGVFVQAGNNIDIHTLNLRDNSRDVYARQTRDVSVAENSMSSELNEGGQGVVLQECRSCIVQENSFEGKGNAISIHGLEQRDLDITVRENSITDSNEAVNVFSTQGIQVIDNQIQNPGLNAIYVEQSNDITIAENNIRDLPFSIGGISLVQTSDSLIYENVIENGQGKGIYLGGSSRNMVSGNTIRQMQLDDQRAYNILITAASQNTVLEANVIENNLGSGIIIKGTDALLEGTILRDNTIQGNSKEGVLIENARATQLESNTIESNGLGGIVSENVGGAQSPSQLTGNRICNNEGYDIAAQGFHQGNNNFFSRIDPASRNVVNRIQFAQC